MTTPELDHLWAGWRHGYITKVSTPGDTSLDPDDTGSLFERILRLDDDEAFIVHRGRACSVLLNAFPYCSGHMLVVPDRAVAELEELTAAERHEMADLTAAAVVALRSAYRCDGVNVGTNLGEAAGAGVPTHLHTHVLPRWSGDTNFMTAVALTRVLPEPLDVSCQRLRQAWPADTMS
ncbi:MAG: HIT domain-containing protein [Actinobacteria bacterium]|nr:HIT domain-containing protein [Actinomycetota bacterium]